MIETRRFTLILTAAAACIALAMPTSAQEEKWEPVTGAETLTAFMSGLEAERKLPGGGVSRGEYSADGTGVLHSWGELFPRTWRIEDDSRICITQESVGDTSCVALERSTTQPDLYRVRNLDTGEVVRFRADAHRAVADSETRGTPRSGGPAAVSASEMAAKLADPNAVIGTMTLNLDFIAFDGDLEGASDQSSFTLGFQPSLPYPLGGGKNFFVRPLIPIIVDQPVPSSEGGFETFSGELGNIGFDAAVGLTLEGGKVVVLGVAGSLPTATDDAVGSDQWLLGPELAFFRIRKWGVLGVFASHLWDVAGDDSFNTSITSGQYIYNFLLKDGWSINASPPWSYNHEAAEDAFTFAVGIGVGKTAFFGGRPWKLGAQYYHFIEGPQSFGSSDQIKITIGPVINLPWGN
jgi:hypothetical protein